MEQATGVVHENNHVPLDEAKTGRIARPASAIPDQNRNGRR
jgi:hypothetical protein